MSQPLCHLCQKTPGSVPSAYATWLPFPVCPGCLDYSFGGNTRHVGRASRLPTFSVEFEVHSPVRHACTRALTLLPLGYQRTHDCTVDDEYKSPIYHTLTAFRAHLPVLDTLRDLVDEQCGTHLHVGFPGDLRVFLDVVRPAVFQPLLSWWSHHEEETAHFWGRTFTTYAMPSLEADFPCVRMEGCYDTIEYRLPRYRTSQQYIEVVRVCRRITQTLATAFTRLEVLDDPYGEGAQARREGLTPGHLGVTLLHVYRETLQRVASRQHRQTRALAPHRLQHPTTSLVTPLPLLPAQASPHVYTSLVNQSISY